MTNEEALKIIGKFMPSEKIDTTKKLDALMQAMHALERQIPKKPFKNRSEYYCSECGVDGEHYTCVGKNHRDGHKTRHDYCFNCGQAIDWSDENEDTARH